ncbi:MULTISPECIES: 3-methyl-2-oxobutanoate hydroxymethyltransferase [Nostocales]|uniref:3-methyl-2-oxobutanoate hydroxymethyltransferase n=3 Tax=Nostocales TaxID=1161 RepID=A0A0C1N4F3_9CYAN|nr:3-methyl-2-oxobutanoate hydroxymethyltransferase [Tolypothrix bouteillei]KAF3889217.1 3-methyl-2-oxobutanoate hydroxymethyltransferase [Tolypothrix bouteillei VB521301]
MKKDLSYLLAKKQNHQKIVALTAYDYPTALLEDKTGVDIIFVGDSVGTNILGYDSEQEVTVDDIAHHLKAVRRGVSQAYILGDLPYNSYETPEQALDNAKKLLAHGADIVKLEGVREKVIKHLIDHDIKVCGHLGLLPQTQQQKRVQGKTFEQAKTIIEDAIALEKLGISMLVLELIPEELGQIVTEKLSIPTIGIGSGRFTDGQVLIVNDILGITPRKLKLAKTYQDYQTLTAQAIQKYKEDVEQNLFPTEENVWHMAEEELKHLR